MKLALASFAALLSVAALAMPDFPQGTFNGSGTWKSTNRDSGQFDSQLIVSGHRVISTYTWDGRTREVDSFVLDQRSDGLFNVSRDGRSIGKGYCVDKYCHWRVKVGDRVSEETFRFTDDRIERIGSKTENGVTEIWQEKLQLQ